MVPRCGADGCGRVLRSALAEFGEIVDLNIPTKIDKDGKKVRLRRDNGLGLMGIRPGVALHLWSTGAGPRRRCGMG